MPDNPLEAANTSKNSKKNKNLLIILGLILFLLIVGIGYFLLTSNKTAQTTKEATSVAKEAAGTSSKLSQEVKKQTITKVGFVDKNNIWVLDVLTKKTVQITKDAAGEIYYQNPFFLDAKTFVYVKRLASGSELWRGVFNGEQVSLEQSKKFKSQIYLYNITKDFKKMVFSTSSDTRTNVNIYDLETDKNIAFYDKETLGRGASQDDAFYGRISPDGSKVLLVDTFYSTDEKISVWDLEGKKIVGISGSVTHAVWSADSQTFFYKELSVGLHQYSMVTKSDQKINSEKDWTDLVLSPKGDKIAHNKGLISSETGISNSSVDAFDVKSKNDQLIADSAAFPVWVNDEYIALSKLRKCKSGECASDDPSAYTIDNAIVVVNIATGQKYEVSTQATPTF